VLLLGGRARAEDKPTLSGAWTASALSESWSVDQWGEACGPRPAPQGAGGGAVQIREQGGELSISGAGRSFSTAQCWEQMPGVARSSHSQSGGGRFWRTRCTSGPNDSRRTAITTSISATDTTITLNETGDYTFTIQDTNCHASVTRSRSYSLVHRDGDTPPAASASAAPSATVAPPPPPPPRTPDPKPAARCPAGSAGEPARLEVHPSRKLLRAGEKFTFRALVLDADGCGTGTRPTWTIAAGPLASRATIDATGTLGVAADADEGQLEISASVAGKGVVVRVDVASAAHYDAMLGVSGLNDAGEADQPAVAVIATGTIGGRTASAQDGARERKVAFVAIVGGLAALLAFAGLVLVRRGAKPVATADDGAAADAPPPSSGPTSDPGLDEPPSAPAPAAAAPPSGAVARPAPAVRRRGKICPTCGERFGPDATFCGKDGTTLVLLN
jgi:hypothetical protein